VLNSTRKDTSITKTLSSLLTRSWPKFKLKSRSSAALNSGTATPIFNF